MARARRTSSPNGSAPAGPASSSSSGRSRTAHLVSRQTVRHGVGRPRHLYDVTADAQDLFPSNYDGLAAGLLAAIEAVGGDDLLDQVFAARRRQLGDRVRSDGRTPGPRRAAGRAGPRAGRHPGRAGLSRRRDLERRRHDPAARAQLRDLPGGRGLAGRLPGGARAVHARSSAQTSSARRISPRATAAARTGSPRTRRGKPPRAERVRIRPAGARFLCYLPSFTSTGPLSPMSRVSNPSEKIWGREEAAAAPDFRGIPGTTSTLRGGPRYSRPRPL